MVDDNHHGVIKMPSNNPSTPNAASGLSSQAQQAFASNMSIRKAWLNSSAPLIQAVAFAAPTYAAGTSTVVNLLGSATGLIRKFYLVVTGTLNATSGTFTPTAPFGITNIFSNITFTDLNTRVRHNTTGAHLHMIQACRRGWVPGMALSTVAMSEGGPISFAGSTAGTGLNAAYTPVMGATGGGANWGFNYFADFAPSTFTGGTAKNFQWTFEIPVAYTDTDLRGCIWANQVTANNLLSLTLNPNFFLSNSVAADVSSSAYNSATALATALPTLTNLKFTLYQDMFVQGPQDKNGNIMLPQVDMAYSYNLLMVPAQALQANSDNVFFAAPNRQILSHMLLWDNYLYNTSPPGSDVTSIKIQIANSLVVRQMEPGILAYWTRNLVGTDMPVGSSGGVSTLKSDFTNYYIDTRRRPLNVQTSGNIGIYFNPNAVMSGAALNIGYEYLEIQSATFNAPGFGL
jgi:hypothetical protein